MRAQRNTARARAGGRSVGASPQMLCVELLLTSHMRIEKPQHFLRGIGAFRIGIRTAAGTARPGMTCSVHDPLLGDHLSVAIVLNGSRIRAAVRHVALFYRDLGLVPFDALRQHLLAIAGMNRLVAIAMEHNDRNRRFAGTPAILGGLAIFHDREC